MGIHTFAKTGEKYQMKIKNNRRKPWIHKRMTLISRDTLDRWKYPYDQTKVGWPTRIIRGWSLCPLAKIGEEYKKCKDWCVSSGHYVKYGVRGHRIRCPNKMTNLGTLGWSVWRPKEGERYVWRLNEARHKTDVPSKDQPKVPFSTG